MRPWRGRWWLLPAMALVGASGAGAARKPVLSWGKAGVTFDAYRQDAGDCGRAGYYQDVSGTEAAQVFRRATSALAANETDLATPIVGNVDDVIRRKLDIARTSERIVEATRPRERFAAVRAGMQDAVDQCLTQRGYVRFQLTPSQATLLARYRPGSEDRRRYLYSLAVDPRVLDAQRAPIADK